MIFRRVIIPLFIFSENRCPLFGITHQRVLKARHHLAPGCPGPADSCAAAHGVFHWITSSAIASSEDGTVRSSIRAVEALMASSYLLDWTTGRSAGLAPLRMRPT